MARTKIIVLAILAIGLTAFAWLFSSQDFQASIVDGGAQNDSGKDLYISDNYTALNEDTGTISVESGSNGLSDISALTFTLRFNANDINFTENYTLGNFTDTNGDSITPEIAIITPDNTAGEVTVDIASSSAFSLAANSPLLTMNVELQSGTSVGDLIEISFADTQMVDSNFNIRSITSSTGKIEIVADTGEEMKVLNATAIDNTHVEVVFDDFLRSTNGVTAKITSNINAVQSYAQTSADVSITDISIDTNDGTKLILETDPLTDGTSYKIVFGNGPSGNIKSSLDSEHDISYFSTTTTGTASIQSVQTTGQSTLSITLNQGVSNSNVTNPTKYRLFDSEGNTKTIASVQAQGSTLTLTTQTPFNADEKYYVIIEDIPEMSSNKVAHFFVTLTGSAKVLSFSPESLDVSDEARTVQVTGTNLTQIQNVRINNQSLTVSNQSGASFSFNVPATLEADIYDLEFITTDGAVILREDAFVITNEAAGKITVVSEESYASPQRVPNDGQTTTTLWALIEDPQGVADISKVTLDLRTIGGKAVQQMIGVDENGQAIIVDNKRWFFLETTVPDTVATSETAKEIQVTAEDTHGNKAYGTISLTVTKNVKTSETPEILEAYSFPNTITPGSEVGFYARVRDLDGIGDIDTVSANLGALGMGLQFLRSADTITSTGTTSSTVNNGTNVTDGNNSTNQVGNNYTTTTGSTTSPSERTVMWFGVEDLELPESTSRGTYDVEIIATDTTGEEASMIIQVQVGGGNAPEFDEELTQITPRRYIPNDGQTTFTLKTFISDEDGVEDITAVYADLQEIGGTVVELDFEGEVREGQIGGFFIVKDLTVARETNTGTKQITLYAHDKQGNISETELDNAIRVTDEDEVGDAPVIDSGRSYTTPAHVEQGDETKITLNAFIENGDFDISQVIVDLSNIAQHTGTIGTTSSDAATSCLGATERMVCMTPGIQEGTAGQWYTLKDVVVLPTTAASMEPYQIPVTAIDSRGKQGFGHIYLNVGDGTLPTEQIGFPKVQMAISTSPESVEVLFSNPIDPRKVSINNFRITNTVDVSNVLVIRDATINADGTVVTLSTNTQEAETFYTLFADAKKLGLKESQYTDNHADFVGFDKQEVPPQIVKITPKSPTTLEVIFSEGLRPSSVKPNGTDFQIFTHEAQPVRLAVKHVEFQEDNLTLRISTDTQVSEKKYMLRVNNIYSAAGVRVGGNEKPRQTAKTEYFGIHKIFTGYKAVPKSTQTIIESVDFDGNGKIDFTDFTIFSSVYGQSLQNPTVDVSVPQTSTPVTEEQNLTTPIVNE